VLATTHHQGHYTAVRQSFSSHTEPSFLLSGADSSVALVVLPLIYQNTLYALLTLQLHHPYPLLSPNPPHLSFYSSPSRHQSPTAPTYTELTSHHMKLMLSSFSTRRFAQFIPLSVQMYFLFRDLSLPFNLSVSVAIHLYSLCQRIHLFKEKYDARGLKLQENLEANEELEALRRDVLDKGQRVDHLERSRLRHYKQSRKLKEVSSLSPIPSLPSLRVASSIFLRKRSLGGSAVWSCGNLSRNTCPKWSEFHTPPSSCHPPPLPPFADSIPPRSASVSRSYEAYNRDVALLHQSMRHATMEIFGSDYLEEDDGGEAGDAIDPHDLVEERAGSAAYRSTGRSMEEPLVAMMSRGGGGGAQDPESYHGSTSGSRW
jgi:hypothetical protein